MSEPFRHTDHPPKTHPRPARKSMTPVCAGCNKIIRPGDHGDASHGICQACGKALMDEAERERSTPPGAD